MNALSIQSSQSSGLVPRWWIGRKLYPALERLPVLPFTLTLAAALYLWPFVDRGWVPSDEGMLGQIAERTLHGDLPHVAFDDPFTGLLTFLYATVFRYVGQDLIALRWLLLGCTLLFVPALYSLARRFAGPMTSAAVTATGFVWSLPNYFAGLPSWYLLFLSTFVCLCLLRHAESGGARHLLLAGVLSGIAVLIKQTGIYLIVATALYILYYEQTAVPPAASEKSSSRWPAIMTSAGGSVVILGVIALLRSRLKFEELTYFAVPLTLLVILVISNGWARRSSGVRLRAAGQRFGVYTVGAAVPVLLFLVPYLQSGTLWQLGSGAVVSALQRVEFASAALPPAWFFVAGVPYGLVLCRGRLTYATWGRFAFDSILLAAVLVYSILNDSAYSYVFNSARLLSVVVVASGCLVLWRSKNLSQLRRRQLFLVLAVGAWAGLVQFPYCANLYFCYVAPLVSISVLAVVSTQGSLRLPMHAIALVFYFLFAVTAVNRGYLGYPWLRIGDMETPLGLPRASLRVLQHQHDEYAAVTSLVLQHRRGDYIYAAPDCPEVYYLSGSRNPTRHIFEFLGRTRTQDIESLIQRHGITVVVLNRRPYYSGPLDARLAGALRARFARSADIGPFEVRWRP